MVMLWISYGYLMDMDILWISISDDWTETKSVTEAMSTSARFFELPWCRRIAWNSRWNWCGTSIVMLLGVSDGGPLAWDASNGGFLSLGGTPKSSILIGFSMKYKPSILEIPHDYGNLHICSGFNHLVTQPPFRSWEWTAVEPTWVSVILYLTTKTHTCGLGIVVVHFLWVKNKLALMGMSSVVLFVDGWWNIWIYIYWTSLLRTFRATSSALRVSPRFFWPARDIHLASWCQPWWGFRYYHYPHHSMECRWFLGAATQNLGGWFFITHGMWGWMEAGFLHPMILLWTSKKVTEQQQKVREMMVKVMR